MRNNNNNAVNLFLLVALVVAPMGAVDGFTVPSSRRRFSIAERSCNNNIARNKKDSPAAARAASVTVLRMGLYDTPLPPRPPPRDDGKEKKDEDDDETVVSTETRLFQFGVDGKEVNDLLPPLKRRLTSGIDCYFEPTDRLVRNLVDKTACAVPDACWALEACRGDITEAWTRISTARRLNLQRERESGLRQGDEDYDPDDYDLEVLDEFERRKRKLRNETEERRREEYRKLSGPNDDWLPVKNPKPIDDEPWFTG